MIERCTMLLPLGVEVDCFLGESSFMGLVDYFLGESSLMGLTACGDR